MATHDYVIANGSGAAVRADINGVLSAIVSNNSSATEPTTTYAYQMWADIGSTPPVMKQRNSTDTAWITLFKLDGTSLPSSSATEIAFNDAGADLDFRIEGDTEANLFFVDAGNDRVGIGNNAPVSTLDVTGAITSKTSTAGLSDQSITFTESGSGNAYGVRLGHVANTELAFERYDGGWIETVRIDGAGQVGIGADPSSKLHLAAASGTLQMQINNGGTSSYIGHDSAYTGLDFAAGGGIRFRYYTGVAYATAATIDSSGNLGVGVTSPAAAFGGGGGALDVAGPALARGAINGHQTNAGVLQYNGNVTSIRSYGATAGTGEIRFSTGGGGGSTDTERVTISSNGLIDIKGGQIYSYGANTSYQPNASASIVCLASEAVMYRLSVSIHYGGTSVDSEVGYLLFSNTSGGYKYDQVVSSAAITVSISYGGPSTATVTATGPASSTTLYLRMLRMS